jgi:iron complex outermembrane receptor protein
MPSSTTLRSGASPLDTSQSVNIVPEQVIKDQLPRNIDDALVNIGGITQTFVVSAVSVMRECTSA